MSLMGWLLCLSLLAADQWVLGPALFTLFAGWHVLSRVPGLVIPAAFTYQWLQITIALIYLAVAGRQITDMKNLNYQPMVLIALASIVVFFGGYYLSSRPGWKGRSLEETGSASLAGVAISYAVAFAINLLIQRNAWSFPAVTQILYILSFAHFALLYVLVKRLMKPTPRWGLILLIAAVEVAIGFSAYFASFREPLVFIGLAITASLGTRRATTWIAAGAIVIAAVATAVTWTAIKPIVRDKYSYTASTTERLRRAILLIGPALSNPETGLDAQMDRLVSRIWMMRFPSLTLERVPKEVPHERGRLLTDAAKNTLMPRLFFAEKGVLPSESDKVRKYAGVWVAGRERRTSHAFGYVAESYVDFGLPMMLLPILVFGCLIGFMDRLMYAVLKDPDVLNGVRVVVLWSSMYLFEQSWAMMIGTTVSLLVILVGGGALFERAWLRSGDLRYPSSKPLPRLT